MAALLFLLTFLSFNIANGNSTLTKEQLNPVENYYEDSLKVLATQMMGDSTFAKRDEANKQFTKLFKKVLKMEGAFDYPFDSLITLYNLAPDDQSFRIFTWQICEDSDQFHYYGIIQRKGEKDLVLLKDKSEEISSPEREILSARNWYGALYYNMVQVKHKKNIYYMLFGFDANSRNNRRKLIDVLTFDDSDPVFGAPILEYESSEPDFDGPETYKVNKVNRILIEYASSAAISVNYNTEKEMIIYDHMIYFPSPYKNEGLAAFPDGSYKGLEFKKGKWKKVDKVFDYIQTVPPGFSPDSDKSSGIIGPGN